MSRCHSCSGTGRMLSDSEVPSTIIGHWRTCSSFSESEYHFDPNGKYSYYSTTSMTVTNPHVPVSSFLNNKTTEFGAYDYSEGVLNLFPNKEGKRTFKVHSSDGRIFVNFVPYSKR